MYDKVASAVAYIETDTATGSAVLFENGWIITNAHVVWPQDSVRLVFEDGEEHFDVPVIRTDDYLDLALLGPISTDRSGVPLLESVDLQTADEVYLIGYPAEIEEFPSATITRGLVSRIRTWEKPGIDFIQSDTAIAGGQSGGALVSADGEVIGISGLSFSDANFALSIPIDAVATAAAALADGTSPEAFAESMEEASATESGSVVLSHVWDEEAFVFEGSDELTEVSVSGGSDPFLTVIDSAGEVIYPGESDPDPVVGGGVTTFTFDTFDFGPVYVYITDVSIDSELVVTSNQAFAQVDDPNDAKEILVGGTIEGSFGIPADYDWYRVELDEGQTITVTADSLSDVELVIDRSDNFETSSLADDYDSGGGFFGTNPELTFTAEEAGEHIIVIYEAFGDAPAGYLLTVE